MPGDDLLIIAVGSMVGPAVEASRHLAADGIAAGVLNARFVKPLDRDLILERAAAVGKVLTVEEGVLAGGFGSGVLELFSDEGLDGLKTSRMGIPDTFVEHGTRSELMADLGLTREGIARARPSAGERASRGQTQARLVHTRRHSLKGIASSTGLLHEHSRWSGCALTSSLAKCLRRNSRWKGKDSGPRVNVQFYHCVIISISSRRLLVSA